ncbi:MAG: TIGR03663 family protein [Chloroflexi bacterium]|nr:TIGR03663 family protein [Chloroflexota bacterium]
MTTIRRSSITTGHDELPPSGERRALAFNWEVAVYVVIFALAVFTRFYMLGDRVMSHDESLHTKFSHDLYKDGVYQHTPLMHGPILFHVTALMYSLFGDNDFTARLYPAVLGVLIVMFPVLFRRWLGRWGAILAAVMFLISPLLLYYNRYIRHDTPAIFYTLVMVYCAFMYINGPLRWRRKARWLFIFAAAMLGSMGSKETSFIYIAIFGSFLTLYWVVRLVQHFFRLPGKTLLYFISISVLLAGVASLAMYVVLSIAPLDTALSLGPGTLEYASLLTWTGLIFGATLVVILGTLLWTYRRQRIPRLVWADLAILLVMVVAVCAFFIFVEERSHVTPRDASSPSAPVIPGEEGVAAVVSSSRFSPLLLYVTYGAAILLIAFLVYTARAGWWRTLYRFRELDILWLMGTLVLPWLTPFLVAFTGVTAADYQAIGQVAPEFIKNLVPVSSPEAIGKTYLAIQFIIPMFAVTITAGLVWNARRWVIASGIYHVLYVFFFTTVFTNMTGLAGIYTSLDYWLEQQAVRRGNQPQYYYLVVIMPFYEFLPLIGSFLAMIAGLMGFWGVRRRVEERKEAMPVEISPELLETQPDNTLGELLLEDDGEYEKPKRKPKTRPLPEAERLTRVPFLLFVSWGASFMHVALTLAGEKMPWLGTHLTVPLILLSAWFFGRIFERVSFPAFRQAGWLYTLLFPVLFVALVQVLSPVLVGPLPGGLEQAQLARIYQWIAGFVVAAFVIYTLYRLVARTGWAQFRLMLGVVTFAGLAFITLRSAWMASFINYDLATEYLVYAHAAPANKRVTEQLEELSRRITDGMDIKFAYDYRISWPGAWYFRNFKNAVFMGESVSPRVVEDAVVVIVGDENRAAAEAALEDRYYRFDYQRLWWPMQDYFGLTPQRVINTFDFSPSNTQAAQIRRGIFNIWWWRDYTTYGEAVGKSYSITAWPVADRMYVFVRKDVAAQVWSLGAGEGTVMNPLEQQETNLCSQNWQSLSANRIFGSAGVAPGQLSTPRQIAVGPDGKIYVAEEFNHRVSVFNPDGSLALSFGQQGGITGGVFERPNGIAVGPDGSLYVADTWNYRIQKFTPEGEFITAWGQRGEYGLAAQTEPTDGFWGPRAVAVDAQGRVYVADTGNKRIRVYTSDGLFLYDIGSGGSGSGQLDEPTGLALSPDGILYVADTWNRRISAFYLDGSPANLFVANDGTPVNNFRIRAWFDDLGNRPYLAFDGARGLLYVTDPDAGRVLVYDRGGSCVGAFGQLNRENPGLTEFASVGGVVVDGEGNVYVADAGSGRILQFPPFVRVDAPAPGAVEVLPEATAEITDEMTAEITIELTPEVSPETNE